MADAKKVAEEVEHLGLDLRLLHAAVHKVATDQRRKQPTLRAVAEVYLRMKEREEARDG